MDMLSPPITLYYQQKKIHASSISGVLTLIAYIIIFIYGLLYLLRFIRRENPTAYSFNRYVDDVGTYDFKDSNFFNYIQLVIGRSREVIDIDLNKIEIIGINISLEGLNNMGENRFGLPHWLYGKCDNDADIFGINDLIDKKTFNQSACLKKFFHPNFQKYLDINDSNFEWPSIKHGASHLNVSFYGAVIKKCINSTFRLRFIGPCSPENEIAEYLNGSIILSFNTLDHYVDVLNYKNPISQFPYSVNNLLERNSYITNNLNFHSGSVKSYDNLFNQNFHEQNVYFFHENQQVTTFQEGTNYLGVFFFWLQNNQQYYERRYQKIQNVFSEIGGFGSIIMMIAHCINYLISRFNMLADTQELISNILNKNENQTVYEKIIQSPRIRRYIKNDQNEENKNIKKFSSTKEKKR